MRTPALLLISLLAACSDKVPVAAPTTPPVAAKPAPAPTTQDKIDAILMKAVFGAQYQPGTQEALVTMPDPDNKGATEKFLVTAAGSTVLKTGETVFVTSGEHVDEEGKTSPSTAQGGLLSVYFMRQENGKWEIIKRHENIDAIGSNGQFGPVLWPMLGKGKPGMAINSFYMNQGISIQMVTLFDLANHGVRAVTDGGILTDSSNGGDCDEELAMECWDTSASWRVVPAKMPGEYDDLLLETTGTMSAAPGERKEPATGPRVTVNVAGKARYAFDGKHYKVVEGENLVRTP